MVSPSSIKAGDNVTVKVTVKNTGKMDGDEVGVVMTSPQMLLVHSCCDHLPQSLSLG